MSRRPIARFHPVAWTVIAIWGLGLAYAFGGWVSFTAVLALLIVVYAVVVGFAPDEMDENEEPTDEPTEPKPRYWRDRE